MDRLRGCAETTVDDKGRFKVPALHRAPIEEMYGVDFFVTSISGEDVIAYPMPVWNTIEEKLAAFPAVHRVKAKFLTRVNTFGQVGRMDGQGRLLIPSLLRETAGIQGEALVIGQTDHLLVVDKARHLSGMKAGSFTDEDYHELERLLV